MAERFMGLPARSRLNALEVAATKSGRPAHLLEKDVWVVWALQTLFESPFGEHLVFKGGTSLSKAHNVIKRFSEDVDITYDIREIIPDLIGADGEALLKTGSQGKRWSKEIRKRLPDWVTGSVQPQIDRTIRQEELNATTSAENDKLFIKYKPAITGSNYVAPRVMLEFGARSTGEPASVHEITCDAAALLDDGLVFPVAHPKTMKAERTFWEKATAIHVYCLQKRLKGKRFSRHFYDLVKLDDAGIADSAISDRGLARSVAKHKSVFFAEKGDDGKTIDYEAAVSGGLCLVPKGTARDSLREDYQDMLDDGLLREEAEDFEDLLERCLSIVARANGS
ncbi:MAG: nucleotidyl transferase AbiEii/AbiGii toxin family protein [Candidatus Dadabacteria bacterium]|nr:nucleotidyl transferase AbiEii/AbiGii toxin family protein [Candidatus Dadabacteria bacterium]